MIVTPYADNTTSDELLECLYNECSRLFQRDFLIFLNSLVDRNGKERLIYAGIEKARQLFTFGPEEHWNALAAAEIPLPESKESKHFLKPATPPTPTPHELSEYFKEPFANSWQANELAICRSDLKDVGQYRYISFSPPSSKHVAHIVFNRNEQVPQIGQISPCFQAR